MGLKEFFKNTFLRMDMLSASPTFRTRKQPNFQTIFGGILSLIIMGIFSYILYVQLYQMFNSLSISYTEALAENISSSDSISEIKLAVTIEGIDLNLTPGKFLFTLSQVSHASGITSRSNILLAPCRRQVWKTFGSQFQTQFNLFKFWEMLCIKSGQSVSLSGFVGSNNYGYLQLQISKCDVALDVNCDTTANVDSYMSTFLTTNDFFNVKIYVIDTIISPEEPDPITLVIEKNIFLSFTQNLGTTGYITFSKYTLQTDINPWPIQTTTQMTGSFIQKFHTNAVARTGSKYITLNFYKSTKSLKIRRVMGKFDSVLSYVGGLFGILFGFIAFMIGSYSQRKYELYVAQSLLKDDHGDRIKSEDFHFFSYIGYSIYDWMDTFGIAPQEPSYFKRVHQIRQEVNEHLDPVLMLKRINYLENACKILINDNEQLMMHLKEPMTLDESKKMRILFSLVDQLMLKLQKQKNSQDFKNKNNFKQEDNIQQQQIENMIKVELLKTIMLIQQSKKDDNKRIKQQIPPNVRQMIVKILSTEEDKSNRSTEMIKNRSVQVYPLQIDNLSDSN